MPAKIPRLTDLPTLNIMDFSRNSQSHGFNNINNSNDQDDNGVNGNINANMNLNVNMPVSDQELLRRLAASRAAGLPMGQGPNGFCPGPGAGAMFGQGIAPNQFTAAVPSVGPGVTGMDPRFMMQHHDREEELLLQLLLARRRRQELQQDVHPQQEPDRSQPGGFTDELLRLRQAGNAASASSAATAAMFAADHQEQQFQQLQQHQHQQGGFSSMFPQPGGLNLPPGAPFMMQDQVAGLRQPTLNSFNGNTFPGGRRLDDYLLRTQQNQHQESILGGMSKDQQRIESSPSRYLSLQQQQQQASGLMGDIGNKRAFGEDLKVGGDLEKMDKLEPATKKKRYHKKKPSDMPRRPLSAYNLFFSEERERILKEIDAKEGKDSDKKVEGGEEGGDEAKKPRALLRPLLPSEKKRRPHRKTHGKISFRLLAQMVGQRWKALPDERRKYYQDMAKEDMIRQKKAMEEYYLKQSEKVNKLDHGGVAEEALGVTPTNTIRTN